MELPNKAQTSQNSKITAPARNVGLRRSNRHDAVLPGLATATATSAAGPAAISVTRWSRGAGAG
jgi:hypothetical protein